MTYNTMIQIIDVTNAVLWPLAAGLFPLPW
jgi:hypothetical protein